MLLAWHSNHPNATRSWQLSVAGLRCRDMAHRNSAPQQIARDVEMQDAGYLRARAQHLRTAAASSRDPEIARALREVAGDFDSEARREEARHSGGRPE
jgi:hypothetical protein